MRRGARAAGALLLAFLAAIALGACETTQEKSARLEKIALKRQANAPLGAAGLKISRPSSDIQVLEAVALHSSEGTAVAVELRNRSGRAQSAVPLLIAVKGPGGSKLYSNDGAGLAASLVSAPYVPAHGTVVWVNDQIEAPSRPASVEATAGEGRPAHGAAPKLAIGGTHVEHEPGGVALIAGTVSNRSKVGQRELVVTALAERGGRPVAAGRAVLAELPAGAAGSFQIFLVGADPAGAKLVLGVMPSTLG